MSIEDYSIMRKSNKGDIKIMNIYTVANILTFEEMGKLIQGKQIRKGYYLYYNKKFTDLGNVEINEDIEINELGECTPFEDLEDMEDVEDQNTEEIEYIKLVEEN